MSLNVMLYAGGKLGSVLAITQHPGHVLRAPGFPRGSGAVRTGAWCAGYDWGASFKSPPLSGPFF
jgi:hypothetical protein